MGPGTGADIGPGPQLELGGRKLLGPQFIEGPPLLGVFGPMPQGPGVLDQSYQTDC